MPVASDPRLEGAAFAVNDVLMDRAIRHATYLERLKTFEVNKLLRFLNGKVIPDLLDQIDSHLSRSSRSARSIRESKRLKEMVKRIRATINTGMREAGQRLRADLIQIGYTEAAWQVSALRSAIPVAIDLVTPAPSLLQSIATSRPMEGRLLGDWWKGLARATQERVTSQINIGLVQGESVPQIMRRLRGTRASGFRDGAMQATRRQAQAIVRTSVAHVTNQANEITYRSNPDVIKGVRFLATLDSRTTITCASLDGQEFLPDEGPRPPLHMNCRSRTVPVTKSWREMGLDADELPKSTRASMNGQVPEDMTYGQWLKRQPKGIQNEVLGRGRAEIFRRGKVSIDKFVDNKLRPISLERLQELEGLVSR